MVIKLFQKVFSKKEIKNNEKSRTCGDLFPPSLFSGLYLNSDWLVRKIGGKENQCLNTSYQLVINFKHQDCSLQILQFT